MDLLQDFLQFIKEKQLFMPQQRLLLAVSGGVDSVVLARLCSDAGFNFGIAHCNFQLRGEDSLRDELFVKKMAEQYEAPFYTIRFDTKAYAAAHHTSTQVAARNLRYNWFSAIMLQYGFDYLVTAHHADDNAETAAMHFFRGTGIAGLSGMPAKNGNILRPLLFARRKQLEAFLLKNNLAYVQDNSNFTDDYTRNYFRNTLLPLAEKIYSGAVENIIHTAERVGEAAALYQETIARYRKKMLVEKNGSYHIPVQLLLQHSAYKTLLYEWIKPFNFSAKQLPEVVKILHSDPGKWVLSATHRILKDRAHLIITPLQSIPQTAVMLEGLGKYTFANGEINIISGKYNLGVKESHDRIYIDAAKLVFPLVLRPWRQGDYFYPAGLGKKKKLSRFFIDNKLSLIDKEKVWVLEMDKKIIWVIGYRADERFVPKTITHETTAIYFIKNS